jgi:hypothetical protein
MHRARVTTDCAQAVQYRPMSLGTAIAPANVVGAGEVIGVRRCEGAADVPMDSLNLCRIRRARRHGRWRVACQDHTLLDTGVLSAVDAQTSFRGSRSENDPRSMRMGTQPPQH